MSNWKRFVLSSALGFALCGCALAQSWRVGAAYGAVNDVEDSLNLNGFHTYDVNGWVDFVPDQTLERLAIRATFGELKVKGSQGGDTVTTPGGGNVVLPNLTNKIGYITIGSSYEYVEEDFYTSGIFGGIGGYRVKPESVDAQFVPYQDPSQTVFGLHIGVDGSFHIVSRFNLVVRLTFTQIVESPRRSLITADAGFVYRF